MQVTLTPAARSAQVLYWESWCHQAQQAQWRPSWQHCSQPQAITITSVETGSHQ